ILKFIGAIATGVLLGTASKTFRLQFAILTAELFVFLFHGREASHHIGMTASPIAGLLSQLQILTTQVGHFGTQLIDFGEQSRNQRSQIGIRRHRLQRLELYAIHDSWMILADYFAREDRFVLEMASGTASAVVYE